MRKTYWQLLLIIPSLVFSQAKNNNNIMKKNYQNILSEMQQINNNIQKSIESLHKNSTPKINTRNTYNPQNNEDLLLSSIFFPGGSPHRPADKRNTSYNYSLNKSQSNHKYHKDNNSQNKEAINKSTDADPSTSTYNSDYLASYPSTYNYQLPIKITFISNSINTTEDPSSTNYTYSYQTSSTSTPVKFTFNPTFKIEQNSNQYENGVLTTLNEIQLTSTEKHISSTESNEIAIFTAEQINSTTFNQVKKNVNDNGNYYTPVFNFTSTDINGKQYQYSIEYNSIRCNQKSTNNEIIYCIQESTNLTQTVTLQS